MNETRPVSTPWTRFKMHFEDALLAFGQVAAFVGLIALLAWLF